MTLILISDYVIPVHLSKYYKNSIQNRILPSCSLIYGYSGFGTHLNFRLCYSRSFVKIPRKFDKIEYCQTVVLYNFFVYQHRVSIFSSNFAE